MNDCYAAKNELRNFSNKKTATNNVFEDWSGTKGLAEDVRRYGNWMHEESFKRIGHLYPYVDVITGLPVHFDLKEQNNNATPVIAWIWVRTVKSSNPAFSHVDVPLASTFILSNKAGKEIYIKPVVEGDKYHFEVLTGKVPENLKQGTKLARGANFRCIISDSPMNDQYIKQESMAGRMGRKLMAVVAEGSRARVYLKPTIEMEMIADEAVPNWKPDQLMNRDTKDLVSGRGYGFFVWSDLFTSRQLVALGTFSDLVKEVRNKIENDILVSINADDHLHRYNKDYADALAIYLSFVIDRCCDFSNSVTRWVPGNQKVMNLFGKQAIAMTWDYPEANILENTVGGFMPATNYLASCIEKLSGFSNGYVFQSDAQSQNISINKVISTDPPYYNNIGYADLSDFFYVWMRRNIKPIYPDLFATMAVPKIEELVATPYRHGSKIKAEKFFLDGMTDAMSRLADQAHPAYPATIYYAFKQSDTTDFGTGNTGWETFLEAVLSAGYTITGTWPMRSEQSSRMIGIGTNALASSIVLVCRKRDIKATSVSRREFIRELKEELTEALEVMIGGAEGISPVAPVDLAQAVIGPGMAIFSKYAAVLEADGNAMSVHDALVLINRTVTEGGDDFDADTQFALSWFDEQGWSEGEFGKADVLARAKGTSVAGVADAGVLETGAGKVRLLKWAHYPEDWSPERDNRTPAWEALHQLIRVLNQHGESAAGNLLSRMPERSAAIRQLAYRLYTLCERKGWAEDARAYNELIGSWTAIIAASLDAGHKGEQFGLDQFAE